MKSSSATRPLCQLSASLVHDLNLYCLGATAAGVATLALAQPAQAKIVYTCTDVVISPYGVHLYNLDLNHDGKTDFVLQTKFYSTTNQSAGTQRLIASGAGGNGVENHAAALKAGKWVGPHQNFENLGVMASDWGSAGASTSVKRGPWVNVNNRYLGLTFKIKGKIHYGWARLSVQAETGRFYLQATLTGYAYETVANKPIVTGKTKGANDETPVAFAAPRQALPKATLAALALGSQGLSIWRREETIEAR